MVIGKRILFDNLRRATLLLESSLDYRELRLAQINDIYLPQDVAVSIPEDGVDYQIRNIHETVRYPALDALFTFGSHENIVLHMAEFGPIIPHGFRWNFELKKSEEDPYGCSEYDTLLFGGKVIIMKDGICTFEQKAFFGQRSRAVGILILTDYQGKRLVTPDSSTVVDAVQIPIFYSDRISSQIISKAYSSGNNNASVIPMLASLQDPNRVITGLSYRDKMIINLVRYSAQTQRWRENRFFDNFRGSFVGNPGASFKCLLFCFGKDTCCGQP